MEIRINKKIIYLFLLTILILLLSYKIPSLATFKNRNTQNNVWNGTIATKYKSGNGTKSKPYIISNGSELAYFQEQSKTNNYEGQYFKITNNIKLNEGIFIYDETLKYIIGENTYYIKDNEYYDNQELEGSPIGTINVFPKIENFKGNIDGDFNTIYGMYINETDASMFEEISGEISSLYIENSLSIGKNSSSLLANKITNGFIRDISVNGYVINENNSINENKSINTYEDIYNYGISSGIATHIENTTIMNCINKANIKGKYISSGIATYNEDSTIINSYNTGNIESEQSFGISGIVKGTSIIDHTYNIGNLQNISALIGYVENSELTISDSFIIDNKIINDENNSTINSSNNYTTIENIETKIQTQTTTKENLKNKTFMQNYNEFINEENLQTNPLNTWIFENDMYPVIYMDDIINPNVELKLNTYIFNSYSYNLKTNNISQNITFMIEDIDYIHNSQKYYYISNEKTPLDKKELQNVEWTEYENIVQIDEEGFYVIYVKIVDNNGNINYINSDLMVLDNTKSKIDINYQEYHWNNITSDYLYIDNPIEINIKAEDELSGVKKIEYTISDKAINDLENANWVEYTSNININQIGEKIVYVKVTDGCDFITYASTPIIVYDGYRINITPVGIEEAENINITKNSSLIYDVTYIGNKLENLEHNLVSNIELPEKTEITLIDNTNKKVYEYTTSYENKTGEKFIYPFNEFKEKGKITNTYFNDGEIANENYTIKIDFSNATIEKDYENVYIYVEGINNQKIIRPTIQKEKFNIYYNEKLTHNISSEYKDQIIYNSDSQNDIIINNQINTNIYDTSYYNKKIGLMVKLVDDKDNIIESENLKNIIIKVGENIYAPYKDNTFRINLNTNQTIETTLSIITHETTTKLKEGTYYLKIKGYASYDGIYYENETEDEIIIPVIVSKTETKNYDYNFEVNMNQENRIIDQKEQIIPLTFEIKENNIKNPNIKISLQKKEQLTAYNQDYTLIDLQEYTEDQLEKYIDGIYYVTKNAQENNTYTINLDTTLLEKTGYRFTFDLYEGNTKVGSINKNIIIR